MRISTPKIRPAGIDQVRIHLFSSYTVAAALASRQGESRHGSTIPPLRAMRIIAGRFRSRRLHSVGGAHIRPTSDKLRETLFNVLSSGDRARLEGSVWIDLFAGTGAVGIEALSRGAEMVYFVERSRAAVELIRRNLEPLGLAGNYQLIERNAVEAISALERYQVRPDFIFLDPPYALTRAYHETLSRLANSPLSERAYVIAESEKKFDPGETFGMLARVRRLDQGDAGLSFYRRTS